MSSYSCNPNICDFFRLTNPTLKPMHNMPILFRCRIKQIVRRRWRRILMLINQQSCLISASPPPPLPPGYKSLAYPAYIDKLTSKYPAAQQMKSISLNRKSGEQVMYISAKRSDYKYIRSANQHINKYCGNMFGVYSRW